MAQPTLNESICLNKYNSKIIGYDGDKDRIPGVDIVLKENQDFKIGNLKFKVFFVPGHTSGHIAFYFKKENIIFTGDTLFSLGCGRIFEGTNEQMFDSLNKFKDLPGVTKIYCGHEYTRKNLDFCSKYDVTNSSNINIYIAICQTKLSFNHNSSNSSD